MGYTNSIHLIQLSLSYKSLNDIPTIHVTITITNKWNRTVDAFCVSNAILCQMINGWLKINLFWEFAASQRRFSLRSAYVKPLPGACPPQTFEGDQPPPRRAKQPAIVHMKCTFWIISCPVIRSNIYREMQSCFRFRRSTRRFHNKLIHLVFCLALNERSYILQATIELFLRRYLRRKQRGIK